MEIKLTWEEYKKIADEAIKAKYPNIDISSGRFYKEYSYEPDGDHYDFPNGIYFKELLK